MQERLEATVRGRVQGVRYRAFACRMARRRKLLGTVENLPDGTVRVIAEGKRAALESFLGTLERGPLLARVERVDAVFREASGALRSFGITHG